MNCNDCCALLLISITVLLYSCIIDCKLNKDIIHYTEYCVTLGLTSLYRGTSLYRMSRYTESRMPPLTLRYNEV